MFPYDLPPACSILSLQREMVVESESDNLPGGLNSLPLSQERLIRKAAGLSHFLINEVTVAPVSPEYCHIRDTFLPLSIYYYYSQGKTTGRSADTH